MALAINPNPYVRDRRSTPKIMIQFLIGLIAVWFAGIIYYFVKGTIGDGLLAFFNVAVCVFTSVVTEFLFILPRWKKESNKSFGSLIGKVFNSYGYISGIILALILPVSLNSNVFVHFISLIITTVVAVGVFKMLFGGFGHNIFNVALVGRIFATLCFGSNFVYGNELVGTKVTPVGSTILSNWSGEGWNMVTTFTEDNYLLNLLIGNYRGTLGETFSLLILIIGVIFIIRKVIDWKLPVFYLGTCLLTSVIVGAFNGVNVIEFTAAQMLTGGIIFGAVFCITDPVTAPTNSMAKIIYAVFAGFLTMLIRFMGSAPEGVAYSILAANMLAPFIANFFKGRTTTKLVKRSLVTAGICGFMVLVSCAYQNVVSHKLPTYGSEVTKVEENVYNVKVSHTNNFSALNMDVTIDAANKKVVSVAIIEDGTNSTKGYGLYFFDLTGCEIYGQTKIDKLNGLKATLYTFDNGGVDFEVFRKYDFNYYDQKEYKEFNDLSKDIIGCGATYTVASYIYGINAIIDVVEGK